MTPKLSKELSRALQQTDGTPLVVEDPETQQVYVLMSQEQFQRLQTRQFDDAELTEDEMLAAAAASLNDPDGWGAPGMEEYDAPDSSDADVPMP